MSNLSRRSLLFSPFLLAAQPATTALTDAVWATTIESFSEASGSFDTDNLISNEPNFLDALPKLDGHKPCRGGVYIGVGPDQNFSYLAHIRPEFAFFTDLRRDNMLEHLLFRALFVLSPTREVFLAGLIGRVPQAPERGVHALIKNLDKAPLAGGDPTAPVLEHIRKLPLHLSEADFTTIRRFHREFIKGGLSLRFTTHNKSVNTYYPTLRDLVGAHTPKGDEASYLAKEELYQIVKKLQTENRVLPLVGNLGGNKAVRAIGGFARERKLEVSCVYVSNVEQYLAEFMPGYFANLASLPVGPNSRLIRSVFGQWVRSVQGDSYSQQVVEPLVEFNQLVAKRKIRNYADIVRIARE